MYAITTSSYRTIDSVYDLQAGETAVDVIPNSLANFILAVQLRAQRDALLAACDWTQGADSPLDATVKAAWSTYRTALRNVPQQNGFPDTVTWPNQP